MWLPCKLPRKFPVSLIHALCTSVRKCIYYSSLAVSSLVQQVERRADITKMSLLISEQMLAHEACNTSRPTAAGHIRPVVFRQVRSVERWPQLPV